MTRKLHYGISLFFLLAVCIGEVSVSQAQIPPESFKMLAVQEKEILVSAVLNYKNRLFELNQDILNLKSDKEWVVVKIVRIQDQGRRVPGELTHSRDTLDYKIKTLGIETGRLNDLTGKHLDSLRRLDSNVKKSNNNTSPKWWIFEPWVLKLMYPGKTSTGPSINHYGSIERSKSLEPQATSSLMIDLEEKMKAVALENWVALFAEENGVRLEVQLPILFGSGKSTVAKDYKKFFRKLSWLLKSYSVDVEVSGYADGPVKKNGKGFQANMELGSNRAANVVKELIETGMPPSAFRIISHGGYARGSDADELSAAMKRRVEVNVFFKENKI